MYSRSAGSVVASGPLPVPIAPDASAADGLLDVARGVNASQVLIGASRRSRVSTLLQPGVGEQVIARSGEIDVHVVTHDYARGAGRRRRRRTLSRARQIVGYLLAVVGTGLLAAGLWATPDLHGLPTESMLLLTMVVVTALVGVGNRRTGEIVVANAGHPLPVLATGGRAELAAMPVGPPLGVGPTTYQPARFTLPVGGTLICYTDGLVERRGEDIDSGTRRLVDEVTGVADQPLASLVSHLLAAVRDAEATDDVAVLAMRKTDA